MKVAPRRWQSATLRAAEGAHEPAAALGAQAPRLAHSHGEGDRAGQQQLAHADRDVQGVARAAGYRRRKLAGEGGCRARGRAHTGSRSGAPGRANSAGLAAGADSFYLGFEAPDAPDLERVPLLAAEPLVQLGIDERRRSQ